jgi:hypothetical protein
MPKRTLTIDRGGGGPFAVTLEEGVLTFGATPGEAEAVVRSLRVARVRCEIEVEDDVVEVCDAAAGATAEPRPLRAGESRRVGQAELRLEGEPAAPAPATPAAPVKHKQLRVTEGADQGQKFVLPDAGTVRVGKSGKHAEIVLRDLLASRVHCEITIDGDRVVVRHVEGEATSIEGRRLTQPGELHVGEVLRVGNTHMRLEPASLKEGTPIRPAAPAKPPGVADPAHLPHVGVDEMDQLAGHHLGHFKIEAVLGRGHSGWVFRADDIKTGTTVALKVLAPEFPADAAELQRFAQALKAAPALAHDHLVALHGAGRTGPYCWIAREYVDGESAAQVIQRLRDGGKPNWARAGRAAAHLARALGFLHEHRAVHGNLTPANVLVRHADKLVKLADLRLAQALDGSRHQQAFLEKKLLAELPYLAPEQTESNAFVDHLADLYSLGAVLYGLLTGRPPFEGATPEETLALVAESQPVRPGRYQKGIPGAFEGVVLKLLSKHQEDRYQTAGQLLADVEPILRDNDVTV